MPEDCPTFTERQKAAWKGWNRRVKARRPSASSKAPTWSEPSVKSHRTNSPYWILPSTLVSACNAGVVAKKSLASFELLLHLDQQLVDSLVCPGDRVQSLKYPAELLLQTRSLITDREFLPSLGSSWALDRPSSRSLHLRSYAKRKELVRALGLPLAPPPRPV